MRVSEILIEGKRRKDLVYETVLKRKEIDKVLVKLEGKESTGFTKLAKEYTSLRGELETLQAKVADNRQALRDKMEELFDPADEVLTRVVETCSLTLQLAKAVQPSTKEEVDYKKAFDALVEQVAAMVPDLSEQIKALTECAVKSATTTKDVPGKASAFTVKEGYVRDFMSIIKAIRQRIGKWLTKYDKKLAKANADLARLATMRHGKPGRGRSFGPKDFTKVGK